MKPWIKRLSLRRRSRVSPGFPSPEQRLKVRGNGGDARAAGDAARDRKAWDEAVRFYEAHLEDDDDAAIWVQLGHARKESGRIGHARAAYERAVELAPASADAHLQLGHALKLQGLLAEALRSYAAARSLDPASRAATTEVESLEHVADGSMSSDAVAPGLEARAGAARPPSAPDDPLLLARPLLARHHLDPALIRHFDAEFYACAQLLETAPGPSRLLQALTHFCEVGFASLAPIADTLTFEPLFYAELCGHDFAMSDVDSYRRWLNRGLAKGEPPNMAAWLKSTQDVDLDAVRGIDIEFHRAAHPALAGLSPLAVVSHLLGGGLVSDRVPVVPNADNLDVFIEAARRAARRGAPDLAMRLLEAVLTVAPDLPSALGEYADRLTDSGRHLPAADIYAKLIETGRATRWSYHLLGRANLTRHRHLEAIAVARRGVAAFPQHDVMRRDLWNAIESFFRIQEMRYWAFGHLDRMADGQRAIDAYCAAATGSIPEQRLPARPIRSVALFANLELPQCRLYRVDQKREQLERAGFDAEVYDARTEASAFMADMHRFDAVVFYRVALLPELVPVFGAARAIGLITFYEIDDMIFDREHYPDRFESFGGQITRDQHISLGMGPPLFAGAMALCDHAIASTPTLAGEMRRFVASGRAFVHRNALGADHLRAAGHTPAATGDRPVTIFYGSGTRAHKEDFRELIEPALIAVGQRHGAKLNVVLVGWFAISPALREAVTGLVVIEPSFDVQRYWNILREADINLAALKPSLVVDGKSEIKWLEAAMFGVPSIVSRTATYAEAIRDGETGILCDTAEDWTRELDRLVRDPDLRRRMGAAARSDVHARYGPDGMAANLSEIFAAVSPPVPARRRRKILFVNVFYAPQRIGGATRVLHDNVLRLRDAFGDEFECEVFTAVDGKVDDYAVESYAQDGVRVTSVSRSSAGEKAVADPRMGEIFRRFVEACRPDLIHFHCVQRLSVSVVDVALDLGIPYLITAHDAWWISDHQFVVDDTGRERVYDHGDAMGTLARLGEAAFARAQALRPALFGAQRVLAVSEPFGRLYRRCGVPCVETVANGLSHLPPRPRVPAPDGRVRLGFVGGMERHKGFFLLRGALMAEPFANLALTVVDHGRSSDFSRRTLWGTVPVEFVGKVDPEEVSALYGRIDVLLAPSVWPESFGLVTREAKACGCWVVASNCGDIGGDVVEDVDGHIIDVSDARSLVAVLRRIDGDAGRYRRSPPDAGPMRRADDQVDDLVAIYRGLPDGPRAGREGAGRAVP